MIVNSVDKKSKPGEKQVHLCNYTDAYYNSEISSTLDFMVATANDAEIEGFPLKRGDVLITKDSETPEDWSYPGFADSFAFGISVGEG